MISKSYIICCIYDWNGYEQRLEVTIIIWVFTDFLFLYSKLEFDLYFVLSPIAD